MKYAGFLIVLLAFALSGIIVLRNNGEKEPSVRDLNGNMKISSLSFQDNQIIPSKYTCDGENINPPLSFSDIPKEAKSLVLIVDDPDAPVGLWVHWLVWNISPETKEVDERSVPSGAIQGTTSFGRPGYGGPCPPSGTHRYFFKLYALDTEFNLPTSSDKSKLEQAMGGHIMAKAELVGLYSRNK